jgi:hypothetical protein
MIGELDPKLRDILLETLPIEFSILDADDKVQAWNKHETRLFKRPEKVVGRDVRDCHPQHSLDKVEQILSEMKKGSRDTARFWIDMTVDEGEAPHKILIEYYALRNEEGAYQGCVEVTQDITDIQDLTGERRLLE